MNFNLHVNMNMNNEDFKLCKKKNLIERELEMEEESYDLEMRDKLYTMSNPANQALQ
jgi:hypothetical protein